MHIFLENKSDKTLFIILNGQNIKLNPFGKDFFTVIGSRIALSLTTEDSSTSEKNAEKLGYYCFNRFVTVSQYDFITENDFALELYVETKRGDHCEAYQRVSPYCKDFTLPEPVYTLKDEQEVKEKFEANEKLEKKAEKRADLFAKIEKVEDAVGGILFYLIMFCLVAGVFAFIWVNFSLKAAIITLAVLTLIGYIAYKIISKILKRIGKTADKLFGSKLFNKAIDKADEMLEEKFVYCKDMPEELFKDRSSFLDPNYISAVFKYSNKNI